MHMRFSSVLLQDADGNLQMEKRLYTGDTFGEYALLSSCPRTASVLVGSGDKDRYEDPHFVFYVSGGYTR